MTATGPNKLPAPPRFSVVIPVRDDAERLRQCLTSIRSNRYPADRIEVIVIDNGSRDGSAEVAERAGARVLSRPGARVGALRNEGVSAATGDLVAFVDADNILSESWFASASATLNETTIGGAGTHYCPPEHGTWVQAAFDRLRPRTQGRRDVEWLGAGNMVLRRQVFLEVGGFDTTLESCEDVDLCNRVRAAGYRLLSDDRLRNVHLGDPATLGALFRGELWRGRDNIRVTLRGPLTARAIPSVVVPVFNLVCLAAFGAGALAAPWSGPSIAGAGAAGVIATSALRAARMTGNDRAPSPWRRLPQNLLVGLVYELARALALVARVTHRTRRGDG